MPPARTRQWLWLLAPLLGLLSCAAGEAVPRHLLLITVDTLRADRLGCYGAALELTPNLDALAAQSQLFERAYAPSSLTLPSVVALLTSRYPEAVGVESNSSLRDPGIATLATLLKGAGWRTGAVVSNFVLRRAAGLDRGFEHYDDAFTEQESRREIPERIAERTSEAALRMLDSLGPSPASPVFLWVHYQDPHGPYTPPPEVRARYLEAERAAPGGRRMLPVARNQRGMGAIPRYQFLPGEREVAFYRAGYDGEVRGVDAAIGGLLAALRQAALLEQTVVVLAADHGEGLGENDYWFSHGEYLSDALVRIPLLIRVPGRPGGRRSDVASLLDVMPTVASLLGVDAPVGHRGRDLLAADAAGEGSRVYLANLREALRPRFGLVDGDYKYLVTLRNAERSERLYRLGRENEDLARSRPELRDTMARRLAELQDEVRAGARERRQPLSAAERERLRALGYLQEP